MTNFSGDDLVLYKNKKGEIQSGGYLITDVMEKHSVQNGGGSDRKKNKNIFNDLAIPAGLLLVQNDPLKYLSDENDSVIEDSLYDKLFKLAEVKQKERKTKRQTKKNKQTKKTKKQTKKRKS